MSLAKARRPSPRKKSSPSDRKLDFRTRLAAQVAAISAARSGERTALRLMIEGVKLLDTRGYRDLNIDEVVQAANVAKGTFYVHFQTKDDFLLSLARSYVAFEATTAPLELAGQSQFEQMRSGVAWYERVFAINVGVLRMLVQMGETHPGMRALWQERNAWIIDFAMREFYRSENETNPLIRAAVRVAGGMLDQSLFERLGVHVGPGLAEPEQDDVREELHALLMYRAVMGSDPPLDELGATTSLVAWSSDRRLRPRSH